MSEALYALLGPDPVATLATKFLWINLTGGAAVVTVALGRIAVRRAAGPTTAYQLWLVPPLVASATLLILCTHDFDRGLAATLAQAPHLNLLAGLWALGAAVLAGRFAIGQASFMAEVRAGRGGPAVVGLIAPRIVMPVDDGHYTPGERELIRAHERVHVARKDPRAAALASLVQCLCWFNPLAHLAAHLLRLDQELACDAAVVMRHPGKRVLYAKTLLKTQLAATPLPFGCYWSPRGRHPLEVRISLLKRQTEGPPSGPACVLASVEPIRP